MPSEAKLCPVCGKEHSPFCCPFCRAKKATIIDDGYLIMVECHGCNARGGSFSMEKQSEKRAVGAAIKAWNTRADRATPDIDKAVEEIREKAYHYDKQSGSRVLDLAIVRAILTNLAPAESDTVKVLGEVKANLVSINVYDTEEAKVKLQLIFERIDKAIKKAEA